MARRKIKNLFRNAQGKWCIDITVKKRRVIRVIGDSKREAEAALAESDPYQFQWWAAAGDEKLKDGDVRRGYLSRMKKQRDNSAL